MAQTKADQGKHFYALFISVVQSKWGFFKTNPHEGQPIRFT